MTNKWVGIVKDKVETKEQLVRELAKLRRRVAALEKSRDEYKQSREVLWKAQECFRQVTENAQEWIWEVDARGMYTYGSSAIEKILGYKLEEIVEKKYFYDLFRDEDREKLKKAAFEAFAKRQPFRKFANRNAHRDGRTVWLLTSGVPIFDEKGNFLGYRGADTDITECKNAEESLLESNKALVRLDRLRTDFVSTASHELRTPLTSIKEVVSQILDGILGETTEQQREFLSMALSEIDRLNRKIGELLDVSRIQDEEVEVRKK